MQRKKWRECQKKATAKPLAPSGPAATLDLATAALAPVEPFQGVGRRNLSRVKKIPPGDRTTNTDCESQGMAMPTLVGVIAETSAVEFFIVGNHSPDFCSVQENVRNS
ncbi:MAG TPA: hypothetical protein VIZ19_17480 [Roseiarcus sp.]